MSKTKASVILILTVVLVAVPIFWYYSCYPTNFQINGKFSARGLTLDGSYENSAMTVSNLLLDTLIEDDSYNMTIGANRGWQATRLMVFNASIRQYPIIYDTILFETNGSVSFQAIEPRDVFISPQNLSLSITTEKPIAHFSLPVVVKVSLWKMLLKHQSSLVGQIQQLIFR